MNIPSIVKFEFDNITYLVLDPGDKRDHVSHPAYVIESNEAGDYYIIRKKVLQETGEATTTKEAAIKKCVDMLISDWAAAE